MNAGIVKKSSRNRKRLRFIFERIPARNRIPARYAIKRFAIRLDSVNTNSWCMRRKILQLRLSRRPDSKIRQQEAVKLLKLLMKLFPMELFEYYAQIKFDFVWIVCILM